MIAATLEMAPIERIVQQLPQHFAAPCQRVGGFEQWRNIDRHIARPPIRRVSPASQQQDRQHIVDAARAADDVRTDGFRTAAVPRMGQRLKDPQRALAGGIQDG